jgi:hypothetical protein
MKFGYKRYALLAVRAEKFAVLPEKNCDRSRGEHNLE